MINTILIVDDDHDNLELMQDLLNSMNFNHVTASTGQEAVEVATRHVPDVILLDMSLGGGLTGLDVAQKIRQDPTLAHAVIIGITADVFRFPQHVVIAGGCDLYLSKPFRFATLRQALFDIQDGKMPQQL